MSAEKEPELDRLEAGIISIEKRRWKYPGSKEQAIKAELGIAPIAYYQVLNSMIDNPRIIALEPVLTRRLREHRSED